ncbi:MAG TPA: GxxExxY protein [Blastocatellia bacterium]|nr:GxxExxY protein [Blastocatellia bacterium]
MNTDIVTRRIIGCAMKVSNDLGVGFLEKVYVNALMIELQKAGLFAEQQKRIAVLYDGIIVGEYTADILVENKVEVELKVAKGIDEMHMAQLLNYLKATGMRIGLIINFGTPKLGIRRMVL